MAEAENIMVWQRLAEAEVKKPHSKATCRLAFQIFRGFGFFVAIIAMFSSKTMPSVGNSPFDKIQNIIGMGISLVEVG